MLKNKRPNLIRSTSLFIGFCVVLAQVLLLSLLPFKVYAQEESVQVTVVASLLTDKSDYSPTDVAVITGQGFLPFSSYSLLITADNLSQSFSVTTDVEGAFTFNYQLDGVYRPIYKVEVRDLSGSVVVTITFTDLNIGTYDQCSNDAGTGYSLGDTGCRWINGNLQQSNSSYAEGEATVQRLWLTGYVPGSTHAVTLKYGTTKGGKHAYDFLTEWDYSEDWIFPADRCQDVSGCETASETSLAIPEDPNVPGTIETGVRNFVMRGGTLTEATTPTIVNGDYSGDSETAITITFTIPSSGSMCHTQGQTTTCDVVLWFGAHVARSDQWSTGGAGSISGSPYHVALVAIDGGAVGSRDNQMSSNAIPRKGKITVIKDAVPNDAQDFTFDNNFGNGNPSTFSLDDDSNETLPRSRTFEVAAGSHYSVSETVPSDWKQTSATCTGTGNTPSNITVAPDGTVTCTFVNHKRATIAIVKNTVGGDGTFGYTTTGGDNFPASFDVTTSGGTSSQTFNNIDPDLTYSVAEVVPSGWEQTGVTCQNQTSGGSVTSRDPTGFQPTNGGTVTCTFANVKLPKLTLVKTVVNDSGGTAQAPAFQAYLNGQEVNWGEPQTLTPGAYTASEDGLSGYLASAWGTDCAGDGTITLAYGDDKTCTITNDDIPGRIIIVKNTIAGDGSFSFDINGPNSSSQNITTSGGTGDTGLITVNAGSYSVVEGARTGWDLTAAVCDSGTPEGFTVLLDRTVTCTFENTKQGKITIVKDTRPNDCQNFEFSMTGQGNFALDDDSGVVDCTDTNQSQSQTFDNLPANASYTVVETPPNAFWEFSGVTCVTTGGSTPYGKTTNVTRGVTIALDPGADVTCTYVNNKLGPTRTLGFWQTHTNYTSSIFSASFPGGMPVGSAPHKGLISNTQLFGQSQLFGAFYASIANKALTTSGKKVVKRDPMDQARMQLLQQLVAAKLNCAAFGCPSATQTLLNQADLEYASGMRSMIFTLAGLLGAYNQSGDTLVIFPAPGNATPALSKSLADLAFWDNP